MKLRLIYEGHWKALTGGTKDYSFLLHGKKDRNRFLRKMKMSGKKSKNA